MSIPVNARVRATPNFLACLNAARAFMADQDATSAPSRFRKLQGELTKARRMLAFLPTSGRPARFLDARAPRGRFQAERAKVLATALGMPELREFVIGTYVLLYAHSQSEVVLLSLRHERQLQYGLQDFGD
ncbi:MAG: hypothetical protein KGI67_09380 [Pseudomonadota bacterium]|nr:hypothetical protein [Pseudomonadota bacterium]